MAEVSRTARVIQNAKVAIFFYCINLILQFFSRKIFLDCLGAELLGINTTAQNLLQFLNIAESGIGAAVAFALYKPLSQRNRREIIDIVSLQGWFYRWVGLFLVIASLILMAFFPWIFEKAQVPLSYAYGTFIAFLFSALLGYFANYKMIVLSADQKEYKITIETQSVKILKILIQLIAISMFSDGYMWWIVIEALAAVVTSVRLNSRIRKEYPWLITNIEKGYELRLRYNFILEKTKQLFFHRMSGCVLTQSTPLIVYFFTTLTVVAIYGNYLVIMSGCLMLTNAIFSGFNSSVGNLVAEGDNQRIKKIFWKIVTLKMYIASIVCTDIFLLSDSFIELWVGEGYGMDKLSLALLVSIFFIQMTRISDIFLSAYGLFQDTWAPIAEAVLNLSLSIAFGFYWGLPGILGGVLLSQIIIVNSWKVYFLYKNGFKESSIISYMILYTKKLLLFMLALVITIYFHTLAFEGKEVTSYMGWLFDALITTVIYIFNSSLLFYVFDSVFRILICEVFVKIKAKIAN